MPITPPDDVPLTPFADAAQAPSDIEGASIDPFEAALTELHLLIESVVGAAVAAVKLAELRALAEANPTIASSILAEELHRWRSCAAAVHVARLPRLSGAGHV
jgi:hypothetical protein